MEEDLRTADCHHKRLDRRFPLVRDRLRHKPSLKVHAAGRGRAEVKAASRFVHTPRVTAAAILAAPRDATWQRSGSVPVVILSADTAAVDRTRPHERIRGGGPLHDAHRSGCHLHNLWALTPERLPLGTGAGTLWARDPEGFALPAAPTAAQRQHQPIEDTESCRGLAGYRQACAVATACPQTPIVVVSDSASDIDECLSAGQQAAAPGQRQADGIIRACQDRAVVLGPGDEEATAATAAVFAQVAATPVWPRWTLQVSNREPTSHDERQRTHPRSARQAVVTVPAATRTWRGPARPGGQRADVQVNAVLVREENPPAGEPAIAWLLLTNLPIATVEQARAGGGILLLPMATRDLCSRG